MCDTTIAVTCVVCGTPLTGTQRRYCSKPCAIKGNTIARRENPERMQRHYERKAEWQRNNRDKQYAYKQKSAHVTRQCSECGATFETLKGSARATCSSMCETHAMTGAWPTKYAAWVECDACGTLYLKRNQNPLKACSATCRTGLVLGEWPKSRVRFNTCPVCGRVFMQGKHSCGTVSACSHECRAVLLFGRPEDRSPRHWDISKARRLRLYERDGYVCQICGAPVEVTADPCSGDWAPTLDHIVPRSRGGHDGDSNLRTAHRWCNSVLGDGRRWSEEVLRVG